MKSEEFKNKKKRPQNIRPIKGQTFRKVDNRKEIKQNSGRRGMH